MDSVMSVIGTSWLLAGIPFAVISFLGFWRFLLQLPLATRSLFLLAGALYTTGAIAVEALCGRYLIDQGGRSPTYEVMVAVEEGLEMVGVVCFVYALMMYMATQRIGFQIVLNSGIPPLEPLKR